LNFPDNGNIIYVEIIVIFNLIIFDIIRIIIQFGDFL